MSAVVLIHGAWHGGWVWTDVAVLLQAAGHTVEAPTMRGHRAGDSRAGVTFEDYVTQVQEVVEQHDEVTLVGHSSAGLVLQAVAPRVEKKLKRLVFLNAFIVPVGLSQFDLVPPEVAQAMTQAAESSKDRCVPVDPTFVRNALMAGESEADIQRLLGLLVPQPLALFTTPVFADPTSTEKVVLFCKNDVSLPAGAYLGMAQGLGPHRLVEIAGGHETLFTHPARVAKALLDLL